jgi:hypothetical protein
VEKVDMTLASHQGVQARPLDSALNALTSVLKAVDGAICWPQKMIEEAYGQKVMA